MVIIWVSIWLAVELADIIGDPLIQKVSPETWSIIENALQKINEAEGEEENSYFNAGIVTIMAEWTSRALVSYLCSCIIIGLVGRKRSQNNKHESIC